MKKINRRQAREIAVQFLYQIEMNKDSLEENFANLKEEHPELHLEDEFLQDIIKGTYEKKGEIDNLVNEKTDNWKISRMGKVDGAVIRLACYEILYCDDIPLAVSIDEAVELAKSFSGEKAATFVNGVLGKIVDSLDSKRKE